MTCPYARFVVHYRNGDTVVQDKKDPKCWNNLNKHGMSAIGIIFDPVPIWDGNKPVISMEPVPAGISDLYRDKYIRGMAVPVLDDDKALIQMRWPAKQHVIHGSAVHNYRFFYFNDVEQIAGAGKAGGKIYHAILVGVVLDPQGHCWIMEGKHDGTTRQYYTTVHSLKTHTRYGKLNLELFEIDLEECGKSIDSS